MWGPPHDHVFFGVLAVRLVSHGGCSTSSIPIPVVLPWCWFPRRFLLTDCCPSKMWFSMFTCLSLIWGAVFALWLATLTDLRKVLDFSVCSAFYLKMEWQTPYFELAPQGKWPYSLFHGSTYQNLAHRKLLLNVFNAWLVNDNLMNWWYLYSNDVGLLDIEICSRNSLSLFIMLFPPPQISIFQVPWHNLTFTLLLAIYFLYLKFKNIY